MTKPSTKKSSKKKKTKSGKKKAARKKAAKRQVRKMMSETEIFGGPSKVFLGDAPLTAVLVDDATLTATIPESLLANAGKFAITVRNGYGRPSNTVYFTIGEKE